MGCNLSANRSERYTQGSWDDFVPLFVGSRIGRKQPKLAQ